MRLCIRMALVALAAGLAIPVTVFFFMIPPHPGSTLFPYTTLFRSRDRLRSRGDECGERTLRVDRAAPHKLRSEEHTSELQSLTNLVCRLLLEKKKAQMDINLFKVGLRPGKSPTQSPGRGFHASLHSHGACCAGRRTCDSSHCFFFHDPPTSGIYTLSLHDALPISGSAA